MTEKGSAEAPQKTEELTETMQGDNDTESSIEEQEGEVGDTGGETSNNERSSSIVAHNEEDLDNELYALAMPSSPIHQHDSNTYQEELDNKLYDLATSSSPAHDDDSDIYSLEVKPRKKNSSDIYRPSRDDPDLLDKDWTRRTWRNRMQKADLIHALYRVGYNKHEAKRKTYDHLIEIVTARRKHRVEEGLLEEEEIYNRSGEVRAKIGRPQTDAEAATIAAKKAKSGITYLSCLQIYSKGDTRYHFAAIKDHLTGDLADEESAPTSQGSRKVVARDSIDGMTFRYVTNKIDDIELLCHRDGNIVFSLPAQKLISDILHNRQLIYTGSEESVINNFFVEAARICYAEARSALMKTVEAQVGGLTRARKLVDEAFSVDDDEPWKKKQENNDTEEESSDEWESDDAEGEATYEKETTDLVDSLTTLSRARQHEIALLCSAMIRQEYAADRMDLDG